MIWWVWHRTRKHLLSFFKIDSIDLKKSKRKKKKEKKKKKQRKKKKKEKKKRRKKKKKEENCRVVVGVSEFDIMEEVSGYAKDPQSQNREDEKNRIFITGGYCLFVRFFPDG